ncbi:MAG: hypothetical protein HN384_01055 [Nitrosopumilus sp.]|jgi:hypothetical protein|nr:hypothetical protein [Nitrosopumilus sp.]MBT3574100.1 hypothetical protein [Nitrosopumilus sp.]MBT4299561.1 hypothetical protein [Nitrosopumilus sp.]MBT6083615.1 hypothetical protein [Nitrosopumilus sp.]MBT6195247.1 hypothetical protein [Nitrosopumilus sp.]
MTKLVLDFPKDNIIDSKIIKKLQKDFDESSEKTMSTASKTTDDGLRQIIQIWLQEYVTAGNLTVDQDKDPMENASTITSLLSLRESMLLLVVLIYGKLDKRIQEKKDNNPVKK